MAEASVVASATSSGADDGVVLVFDSSSPNLTVSGRRGRKNLPKEAYDILKDYFFNVNRYPKKHERLELAARVNSVPGCEAYTQNSVQSYFMNLRKRHPEASTVVVKRELVEEPLSLSLDEAATNGAPVGDNAASISTAPRKKRKSQIKGPGGSLATTSATAAQHALSTASTGASISTALVAPTSASGAPSAQANQKKRTRLKAEGYKILSDFFTNVSRYPTAAQKAELLAVVTAMKGCEGYTVQKLTAYFSRMRIERKQPVAFVKAESPDSLSNGSLIPDQRPPQKPLLAVRPVEPEPVPPQPFLVLRPEPMPPEPPKPFLVLRPAPLPEAEPVPEAEPLLASTQPSPILHITRSALQPPNPTPLASSESHFNVFSIFEPVAPLQLPIDHPATTAGDGPVQPDPPQHPPDTTPVRPSSSVGSVVAVADAPAPATADATEALETNATNAIRDPSDPVPPLKLKLKLKTTSDSQSQKRTLSKGALKMLDDYYTTVTPHPSTTQCETLASQVSALPDGGRCTAKQVRKYFKKRRVEARCEALKAERMGAGAGADEPALVLGAVVEPGSGSKTKSDGLVPETLKDRVVDHPPEVAVSSSSPAQRGEGTQDGDPAVPDVPMEDVQEQPDPEDVAHRSPRPNHDGKAPGGHAQPVSAEEERADAGIEADVEPAEPDSGMLAEIDPCSNPMPGDSLCEAPVPDALAADPTQDSSLPATGGEDKGRIGEPVPDISMVDVSENHESDTVDPASPGSDHGGEHPGDLAGVSGEEERPGASIEADVEHPKPDLELVAEAEPRSNSKSDEPVCEVVSEAVPADSVEPSALSPPLLRGTNEDGGSDQPISDVSMGNLADDLEDVVSEDVVSDDIVPEIVAFDSSQPSQGDPDTPMDVDSGTPPTSVQAEVFALAMRLQRVFSKPPAIDEGHPTTFADLATWLQAQNAGLLCASS